MKAVIIHAAKDLRVEERASGNPGPGQVRIAVAAGGICGSDLHYYNHGGFGTVRLQASRWSSAMRSPARSSALGAGVDGRRRRRPRRGIASRPLRPLRYCLKGQQNQCLDMRFYGSAMRFPHVAGRLPPGCSSPKPGSATGSPTASSLGEGAFAEPFAVTCMRSTAPARCSASACWSPAAARSARSCIVAARRAGAREIVATDVVDAPACLRPRRSAPTRRSMSRANRSASRPTAPTRDTFDVMFEASGNAAALAGGLDVRPAARRHRAARPRQRRYADAEEHHRRQGDRNARLVPLPRGVRARRRADQPAPRRRPAAAHRHLSRSTTRSQAFELAGDRSQSMKVQLAFA